MDIRADGFKNIVGNALGERIPNHYVSKWLLLKVWRSRRVDNADEIWTIIVKVIYGFADLLEFGIKGLSIGVVSFIRENAEVRKACNGLEP